MVVNVANFWYIVPSRPYVNRRFGGTYYCYVHLLGKKSAEPETNVEQVQEGQGPHRVVEPMMT
jgi:hypothetical protein